MQKQLFQALDAQSIEIIRTYAPKQGTEARVAFSGGKDSVVLLDLVKRSGIPFHAVYQYTPIEPKEVRSFIREQAAIPENHLTIQPPRGKLILEALKRQCLPTRTARWCCELYKEHNDGEPIVFTGLRAEESNNRRKRPFLEACRRQSTYLCHPIKDWTIGEVWQYISERELPYCSLYDEGFRRVGCLLCPMTRNTDEILHRFPWIEKVWRRVSDAVYAKQLARGLTPFTSADHQWAWWLDRDAPKPHEDDCPLFT